MPIPLSFGVYCLGIKHMELLCNQYLFEHSLAFWDMRLSHPSTLSFVGFVFFTLSMAGLGSVISLGFYLNIPTKIDEKRLLEELLSRHMNC